MTFITHHSLAPVYLCDFLKFYLYQSAEAVGGRYTLWDVLQGIGCIIMDLTRQIQNLQGRLLGRAGELPAKLKVLPTGGMSSSSGKPQLCSEGLSAD